MPREPRIEFENATYHLTTRGNNRQVLFLDSEDFITFLGCFSCVVYEFGWRCYAYVPMNNHYHTTLCTPEPNLSAGIQKLHSKYSTYYRKKYTYSGRLFEVCDPSLVCDDAYVLEAIRYDLLNPVRAGIVKHPRDWRWSNYRETAGLEEPSGFVDNEWVRSMFDDTTLPARRFIDFIEMGIT